jgi:O-antigen ligase
MLPLFLFLLFSLFQMVPLPFSFLAKISPTAATLYSWLSLPLGSDPSAPPWLPLTLSLLATSIAMRKWFAYASVFFLGATLILPGADPAGRAWIKTLFIAVFIIGFAEAVYGLYVYLNQSEHLLWFTRRHYRASVSGTYINRNHFAGLMGVCISLSVALFAFHLSSRKEPRGRRKDLIDGLFSRRSVSLYFLFLGLAVMVLALIFSMSRMGQFSLVVGATFVVLLSIIGATIRTSHRGRFLPVILLMVLGLGFLWGVWKGLGPVEARWQALEASYEDRSLVWQTTQKLIRDFPVAGTGLGTYELAYPPYEPRKYGARIMGHAHSDYLEVFSELGLAGFIPWLGFCLLFLVCTTYAWFRRRNAFSKLLGAGGLAATVTLLVHSLADFNLQISANAMLLFLIMGLTWRVVNTPGEGQREDR